MKWIIVLGMHRSGTSAITRAVGLLGAAMGDEDRLRKHWENIPLRHQNEQLLGAGRGAWDSPPPRDWLTSDRVQALKARSKEVLEREYPETDVAIWKDPRTCLTLPFWLDLIEGETYFLVVHRHPTEVSASLTTRNSFGQGQGYALWERYNADALAAVAGQPAVVLDYGKVVTAPVEALGQVRSSFAALGLELPNDPASTDHGLVAQERHHTAATADAVDDIATPSQVELFERLRTLEGSHAALPGPAEPPPQSPLSLELLELAGRLRAARKRARSPGGAGDGLTDQTAETRSERRARRRADVATRGVSLDAAPGRPEPG